MFHLPARILTVVLITLLVVTGRTFQGAAQPDAYREHLARADSLYDAGDYLGSARSYESAFEVKEGTAGLHYNAACSWALAGKANPAFERLGTAVDLGFRDVDLLLRDKDLTSLYNDPRWDGVVTRCEDAEKEYLASVNQELYELFRADQADRRGDIDWNEVGPRDARRRERALEMVEAGLLKARDDFIHAAFIFQHGSDSASYKLAHELAMEAVELDSTATRARWIAAASKDRYLQSVGKPQIYGTQARMIDGLWTLEPIDTTVVSDTERAWWGVRTLAEQRKWVDGLNGR